MPFLLGGLVSEQLPGDRDEEGSQTLAVTKDLLDLKEAPCMKRCFTCCSKDAQTTQQTPQKARASAERYQGYSEFGEGGNLASLYCRALRPCGGGHAWSGWT